jgi:hypothetical protein
MGIPATATTLTIVITTIPPGTAGTNTEEEDIKAIAGGPISNHGAEVEVKAIKAGVEAIKADMAKAVAAKAEGAGRGGGSWSR